MSLNAIGFVAAATAFLSIWLGHVAVRNIEARVARLWIPMTVAGALGIAAEIGAVLSASPLASAALGIAGMTLLWDVVEFKRQGARVARGHAPRNPANPRHARMPEAGA